MIQVSFARNLSFALLSCWLVAVSAQARLGSEKIEEAPDALSRILSILESIVNLQDSRMGDPETELVVPLRNWPIDRKVLHEQILTMIRDSLTRDVIIGDGAGDKNSEQVFIVYVPANAANLELKTRGGRGDIDLFVMRGNIPTRSRYDCRSTGNGTRQSCTIPDPEQGTYYVLLHGNTRYSGVSITGAFDLDKNTVPAPDLMPAIGAAATQPKAPSI